MTCVIRYTYPGTVNDQPVGDVYVKRVADTIPGYPPDVFSYTKDPAEATQWPSVDHAVDELMRRHWNNAKAVPLDEATVLP